MATTEPIETCEACGAEVAPGDAVRTELSLNAQMCPTPLTLHRDCYERATAVLGDPGESSCSADPAFPETGRWMEAARRSAETPPV